MKKYSIILPYCTRPELKSSLLSFAHHYSTREDYEVIIVEDIKNANDIDSHKQLMNTVEQFKGMFPIRCFVDPLDSFSPCSKYNTGFRKANGEFIILSSPEIFHESNILNGLDFLLRKHSDDYLVCACRARYFDKPVFDKYEEHFNGSLYKWYQHSLMRNVLFHFCSVISSENFVRAGGFDERYCAGIGFDDESFLYRVKAKGIKVVPVDILVTTHIEHDRKYHEKNRPLIDVNRKLFLEQLTSKDFTGSFVGAK